MDSENTWELNGLLVISYLYVESLISKLSSTTAVKVKVKIAASVQVGHLQCIIIEITSSYESAVDQLLEILERNVMVERDHRLSSSGCQPKGCCSFQALSNALRRKRIKKSKDAMEGELHLRLTVVKVRFFRVGTVFPL